MRRIREWVLTFEASDDGARVDLEFDCCLHEGGIVLKHLVLAVVNVVLLDEVTGVVEARGSHVAASSLERVSQVLNNLVVSFIVLGDELLHCLEKGQFLEIFEHHIENVGVTAQTLDGLVDVDGGADVHLLDLDERLVHGSD